MEISFDRFRCFGDEQSARIAPITLLVGENSSGKSTFMAGLRYILDFSASNADASFNKDPFYLGGYKNIAHFRGGSYGRASEFKIGLSEFLSRPTRDKRTPDLFGSTVTRPRRIKFELTFSDSYGEAKPTGYLIKLDAKSVRISLHGTDEMTAVVSDEETGFEYEYHSRTTSSFFSFRNDFLALEYFLREFSFRQRNEASETLNFESIENNKKAAVIVEALWENFSRVGMRRQNQVLALAPVRTKPLRNYDPTQLSVSSEGDQLILRLGRMARLGTGGWQKLKEVLENYGRQTGLFETIKIQKLGRGESDPFQILVKTSGREANIIDVGYGVSQVLPLFIMLSELDPQSTLLLQQPEVHLHPTAQAALGSVIAEVAAKKSGPSFVIETHSDFVVDRIRMSVRDNVLKPSNVQILFFSKSGYNTTILPIELNKYGEFIDVPPDYREFFVKESMSLMGF